MGDVRLLLRAALGPCRLRRPKLLFCPFGLAVCGAAAKRASSKPCTVGAREIAREAGAQSGYLRAPLFGLTHEFAPKSLPGPVRGHNFVVQPRHCFSQYTHLCPRFPKVRPMRWHLGCAPKA